MTTKNECHLSQLPRKTIQPLNTEQKASLKTSLEKEVTWWKNCSSGESGRQTPTVPIALTKQMLESKNRCRLHPGMNSYSAYHTQKELY
jgi:hypothetical protein